MTRAPLDLARPETWPIVLVYAEVLRVFNLSRTTGDALRHRGQFPVPELLPRIGRQARFAREDVLHSLKSRSGAATAAERRSAMKVAR